ncbi:ABC transporter ATP-binding protein [Acinetobacter sp. ANC 5378]|uniref:ABC transporter ATP-binding protein n=1 Tax=Acinetobacter sp. ANC 5378 TaxID=2731249 RepID=UPI00148FF926|nr:ABC transporter ATP-binding protein [Acinetobacter sp. ANC 5378]NNG81617.1 ABC transporter ATP-binding protein [Acinetobacter sp. ANC 5378]
MFKNYPLLRSLALYRYMPYRFALTALLFLGANIGIALQQFSVGQAIDHLKYANSSSMFAYALTDPQNPWFWFTVIILIASVRAIIQYLGGLSSLIIGQDLLTILREKIFKQVQDLDIKWHWKHGLGEVLTRTTRDADKLKEALINFWRQVFESTLVVLVSIGLLCYYHPLLGLVPLLFIALGLGVLFYLTNKMVVLDHQVGLAYEKVSDSLSENIHGIRVIKAFGLEGDKSDQFSNFIQNFIQRSADAIGFGARYLPIPQIIIALLYVWVMGFGAYLISEQQLKVGQFVAALLMANMLVFRIESIGHVLHIFAGARASAARIWQMLDVKPDIQDGDVQPDFRSDLGLELKVEGLTLQTETGKSLLKNIHTHFKPGQIVTIVGKTGAGKTTLLNMLNRFFDPNQGRVLIGSEQQGWYDTKTLQLKALREYVQIIPQENFCFSGTLAENLRVAKPDATPEEMTQALYLASAVELLERLEHGLDTVIGDKGVTLSGGQKQRISLARAILKDSPILALDDSTSALDAATEKNVLERLKSMSDLSSSGSKKPKTIIINSNKQTTIALSDWIIVLDHGEIVTQGTHTDLIQKSHFYCQIMGFEQPYSSQPTAVCEEV